MVIIWHIVWFFLALFLAVVGTISVCGLMESLRIGGIDAVCGHNGPLQLIIYFLVIFGWLEIAAWRRRQKRVQANSEESSSSHE